MTLGREKYGVSYPAQRVGLMYGWARLDLLAQRFLLAA